jgi:PhzF family phenazine biosynthesis protein
MGQRISQVDAFTSVPFAGNPAAVCVLPGPASERWMQQVANEMNLAETAFLFREGDAYRLRWFTPLVEVDLCGHATLASAHVLWEEGYLKPDEAAQFQTKSGQLTATRQGARIIMDFPALPAEAVETPALVREALGVTPRFVGKNQFDYIVEVETEAALRALTPDMTRLATLPGRGVIVTSRAETAGYDFISRFFVPSIGIPEDPATGSSHCCLAPYWREQLGKDDMLGYQASPRGGVIAVQVAGERVRLGGEAVTVLRGELTATSGV